MIARPSSDKKLYWASIIHNINHFQVERTFFPINFTELYIFIKLYRNSLKARSQFYLKNYNINFVIRVGITKQQMRNQKETVVTLHHFCKISDMISEQIEPVIDVGFATETDSRAVTEESLGW